MGLSDKEIKAARGKLRQQYEKLAESYGPTLFNHERVDERYLQALRERVPVEHFLANEVRILKELEKKAEEKRTAASLPQAPSNADRLLEEFSQRISAWPALEFSSRADDETKRLAGALVDFSSRWGGAIPAARSLPPGSRAARLASALAERTLVWLEPGRVGGLPRVLEDLALALARVTAGERERERLCKEYLKEAGFLCNLLSDLFHELEENDYGIALDPGAAAEAVDAIIYAFRLREFRLGTP